MLLALPEGVALPEGEEEKEAWLHLEWQSVPMESMSVVEAALLWLVALQVAMLWVG